MHRAGRDAKKLRATAACLGRDRLGCVRSWMEPRHTWCLTWKARPCVNSSSTLSSSQISLGAPVDREPHMLNA